MSFEFKRKSSKYEVGSTVGIYTIVRVFDDAKNPQVRLVCEHGQGINRPLYTLNNVAKAKRCKCHRRTAEAIEIHKVEIRRRRKIRLMLECNGHASNRNENRESYCKDSVQRGMQCQVPVKLG